MKTDRFEELLRKKLENYTPDYREQDLDRMFNNIQQHTAPSFWLQYGKIFSNVLAGVTTASLLYVIFYQNNKNQVLNDQINLLQNQVSLKENTAQIITKTDTVYITKYVEFENKNQNLRVENQYLKESIKDLKNELINISSGEKNRERIFNITNHDLNSEENKFSNTPKVSQEKLSFDKLTIKNNNLNHSENQSKNTDYLTDKSNTTNNQNLVFSGPNTIQLNENINTEKTNKLVLNELSIKEFNQYSSNYDLANIKIKHSYQRQIYTSTRRPRYDYQFPDFSLKNTRYRFGVGLNSGTGGSGFSLNNELMFTKNISLNFGLGFQKIFGEEFKNDRQYDYKYGKNGLFERPQKGIVERRNFIESHLQSNKLGIQPPDDIRDIHLENQVTYLPISVNYRIQLKNNFKVLISAGTQLDLRVRENASFRFLLPNLAFPRDDDYFRTSKYSFLQPKSFNNLSFGLGLEKQHGKYAFQLSPYVVSTIKSITYRPQKYDFGLRINTAYQFGKKQK